MTTILRPQTNLSLLDLPNELLLSIAGYLTKDQALALTLACHGLQEIGEGVIWRDLTLTDRHRSHPHTTTFSPTADPVTPVSQLSISHTLIGTLSTYLNACPWRSKQLRSLTLDLRHELPSTLVDVLTLTTGLESFELRSPGPSFSTSTYSLTATLDLFHSLPNSLISLRYLRLDVRYRWNETVVEIINKAPNLEILHIQSHPRRISGGVRPPRSKLLPRFTLPHLRELIVDEMEESFAVTLEPLIVGAINLQAVALRDHAHRWKPTATCPLVLALAGKSTLKRLECTSSLFPFFTAPGAFEGLEALSMLWSTDLAFSYRKPALIIPPLPNLKQYQLDISLHASSSDLDLHRHMLFLPQVAHQILNLASKHLDTCPSLTNLYLSPHLDFSSRQYYICPPPPESSSTKYTGMVIYTFIPPTPAPGVSDPNQGRQITHCRTKVASDYPILVYPPNWSEPYGGNEVAWDEKVFNEDGKELPFSVLSAMYSAAGISLADLTASREETLPEVCWSVLRCWELQQEGDFQDS